MADLIYITNVSLDGYTEDEHGAFDWTDPSDEVFAFITDLLRPMGAFLYGRSMYETMAVWETDPSFAEASALMADFAEVWKAPEKVVYSTTLREPSTARTRIESRFDPDAVRGLKDSAHSHMTIGGPNLTAHALEAGLVDECHLFVHPVTVGTGKPAFPHRARIKFELLEEEHFDNGAVYLRYRVRG